MAGLTKDGTRAPSRTNPALFLPRGPSRNTFASLAQISRLNRELGRDSVAAPCFILFDLILYEYIYIYIFKNKNKKVIFCSIRLIEGKEELASLLTSPRTLMTQVRRGYISAPPNRLANETGRNKQKYLIPSPHPLKYQYMIQG
jgi:hypothetical protein